MGATPDWTAWLTSVWGPSAECSYPGAIIAEASNVVVGNNPAYFLQDFLAMYPKWGGVPLTPAPTCTTVAGDEDITVSSAANMAVGNPVAGAGIPDGTYITFIDGTDVTLSNPANANGENIPLTVWNAPIVPFAVIQAYIALASACLVQARWLDSWMVGIGLFISHFLTLYARSDGNPNANIGQAASQGLAFGVQISKSVGDLSVGYSPVQGIDDWAAWNLTSYGQQLATMAKIIGMGPQFCW